MRIHILQGVVTRLILDEPFRAQFFESREAALSSFDLTDEERAYFDEYTPERLYAFVGTMIAHQVVPIHASRRFTIVPDDAPLHTNGTIPIRLVPSIIFGNGIHPSTQLCLDAIEELIQEGDTVLDVGTGTGILAIAAAKLGAGRVLAVDLLPDAIKHANLNIPANDAQHIVEVMHGSIECALRQSYQARVVIANMLPPVLLNVLRDGLLDTLQPDGVMIMSGMRESEYPPVEEAVLARGVSLTKHTRDEWVSFHVRHAAPQPSRRFTLPWKRNR